jgi:signal transduction histidine kinase
MPVIFFIYGMSFLMLGITIAVEHFPNNISSGRFKKFMSSPIYFLSLFGILHGLHEFLEIATIFYGELTLPLRIGRLVLLSASFYFLCKFGVNLGRMAMTNVEKTEALPEGAVDESSVRKKISWLDLPNILLSIWIVMVVVLLIKEGFGIRWLMEAKIFSRYLIGMPGAVFSSIALLTYNKRHQQGFSAYLVTASLGFALYAVVVSITSKADFYPASVFNYDTFYRAMHVPVQVLRTFCALVITVSLLRFFWLSKDFSSIRFKAILQVIIVVVIPVSVILLLVTYLVADALLRLSYKEHEKFASLTANKIFSVLDIAEKSVKNAALFSRFTPVVSVKDTITSLIEEDEEIKGVAFFDEKGEILRVVEGALPSSNSYKSGETYVRLKSFLHGLTINKPTENFFYISGHDRDNLFILSPMSKGYIEVLLDLNKLYEIATGLKMAVGWHILLLDDKGSVVLPKDRRFGKEEIMEHRADNSGTYRKPILENGEYYNSVKGEILHTRWSVAVEIPRDSIIRPVFDVFKVLLFGVFIVYVTSISVAVLFIGKVTRPIDLIARRVKAIGGGDFADTLTIKTGDELQILSVEVEKMAVLLAEKEKMEKQMLQTEKIASLGRLVAGIAHEINNPIGIMLGYSQVLLKELEPNSRHYEDMKTMEKQALSCKKIVEDLLNFSRTEKRVNIEVDVNANIKEALSLVTKHFSKRNISIVFEAGPDSPRIMGDPNKLHQLFLNLAMNAVDAMQDGGRLTISAGIIDSESERMVEVIFKDTGCGINQDDIGRIFDPFFTTKEVGKGTGLGLSVSYGIVKDHKGEISVESEVGKGSAFHIVFPAVKSDEK